MATEIHVPDIGDFSEVEVIEVLVSPEELPLPVVELPAVGRAVAPVPAELERVGQARRVGGLPVRSRVRGIPGQAEPDVRQLGAAEGQHADEQGVEQHTQRVDVGPGVDVEPAEAGLLG